MFWRKKDKKEPELLFTTAGKRCKGVLFLEDAFSQDAMFWTLYVDEARNKNLLEGPTGDLEEAIEVAMERNLPYAIFKTISEDASSALRKIADWLSSKNMGS